MASASIARWQKKLEAARKSTARARAKAGELMENALDTGLTVGSAYMIGIWEGSTPPGGKAFEFFGVPAPLALGIGAHAAAFFGVGRGMEGHFRSVGNGALAAHLNGLGRQLGQKMLSQRGGSAIPGVSGDGVGISTADLLAQLRAT